MDTAYESTRIEPELIVTWLRARSVARGLPLPVADHGGWRVDTQLPHELQRYVFTRPEEGLRALANEIVTPRVFLKLCGNEHEMRALLTPHWQLQEPNYVMTGEAYQAGNLPLPTGYTVQVSSSGVTTAVRILTDEGELAASGYAAELDGVFIYDRISTEAEYRRRGLGAYLMQALRSARRSNDSTQILVATVEGQALYSSLGWRIRSPYTTAHIP
jgi:GNAT superfamily N-acetyltransferase